MARRRTGSTFARLAEELQALEARRKQVIEQLKVALEQLTLGSAAPIFGRHLAVPAKPRPVAITRTRRKISAEGLAKLRASAKRRWAAARKAGKRRLG
jgi:hypothetical protein